MEPIVLAAGLGALAVGKWVHGRRDPVTQAKKRERKEFQLAKARSKGIARVDNKLDEILIDKRRQISRMPSSHQSSTLSRLDHEARRLKTSIGSSHDPDSATSNALDELNRFKRVWLR